MTEKYSLNNVDARADWEELMSLCAETAFQQTWEYGDGVKEVIDWQPHRQVLMVGDEPVALAQTLVKDIPLIGSIGRMQHGPMFIGRPGDWPSGRVGDVAAALVRHWVEDRGVSLDISPCLTEKTAPPDWTSKTGLTPARDIPWASIRLDLSKPEAKLMSAMKRRWRQPLKKSLDLGLDFRVSRSDDDFRKFLDHYIQSCHELGFSWPSPDLVESLWNQAGAETRLTVSSQSDDWLGAILNIGYCGVGFALAAWNSDRAYQVHAHNNLIWRTMLHYKSEGFRWYDLGGVDPERLAGITKFKRGLGGLEYRYIGGFQARPDSTAIGADLGENLDRLFSGYEVEAGASADPELIRGLTKVIWELSGLEEEIDPRTSLIDGGIIDSLSIVSLVQFIQSNYDIDIYPEDINLDNFDSLEAMTAFISSRLAVN